MSTGDNNKGTFNMLLATFKTGKYVDERVVNKQVWCAGVCSGLVGKDYQDKLVFSI